MPYSPDQLIKITSNYADLAVSKLVAEAKKKEKKKLDPKAKVRNRGTVCVSAEQAKDKKDHFPINDEGQARNALARVQQLSSAPWYKGSLEGLKALVARKVKAKYPKIDVGGKKEKKSSLEEFESMFAKYAQGQPTGYYNPTEQTEEDAKAFMQPGGENAVRGGPGKPQYAPAPQQPARGRFPSIEPAVQEALDKLGFKGPKGESLLGPNGKGDGQRGPITDFALTQYKDKNKAKLVMPNGQPMSDALVGEVAKRDASGENKPQTGDGTFDVKATFDALNQVVGYLTQYQAASAQGQINGEEVRKYMSGAKEWADGALKGLQALPPQQKQNPTLLPRLQKAITDIGIWFKYLDAKYPRSTMAKATSLSLFEKQFAKYAQQPAWEGSPDFQQKQPAQQGQPQGQPAQPVQQPGQGQPAQPPGQGQQQQGDGKGQPPAQPAKPFQFSEDFVKRMSKWIEHDSGKTKDMIDDIKSLKDRDNWTEEKLQRAQFEYQRNLKRISDAKAKGIDDRLDEAHSNMLDEIENDTKIILARVGKEIASRQGGAGSGDAQQGQPPPPNQRPSQDQWDPNQGAYIYPGGGYAWYPGGRGWISLNVGGRGNWGGGGRPFRSSPRGSGFGRGHR